jgi:hypothetical protein
VCSHLFWRGRHGLRILRLGLATGRCRDGCCNCKAKEASGGWVLQPTKSTRGAGEGERRAL